MSTQALQNYKSEEDFNMALNRITGNRPQKPRLPLLKFNATNGIFVVESDQKDKEGKTKFDEIGSKLSIHIITVRQSLRGRQNCEGWYSPETSRKTYYLYDNNRQFVMKGVWRDPEKYSGEDNIKAIYIDNIQLEQVIYCYYEGKPYRLKLGGIATRNLFEYLSNFPINDSVARHNTVMEPDVRWKYLTNKGLEKAWPEDIENYKNDLRNQRKPNISLFYDIKFSAVDTITIENTKERALEIMQMIEVLKMFRTEEQLEDNEEEPISANIELPKKLGSTLASKRDYSPTGGPGPMDSPPPPEEDANARSEEVDPPDTSIKTPEDDIKVENIPF